MTLSRLVVLLLLLPVVPAWAHEGPPFPVVVDHDAGPFLISVWTDPDIGTGTVYVVIEPRAGRELPEGLRARVGIAPVSGRLEEVWYTAAPEDVRYGARFFTEVSFDRGEMWRLRITVESEAGGDTVQAEVEATPDGTIGPIGLLVYFLPFLAVGLLWLKAMRRRRAVAP